MEHWEAILKLYTFRPETRYICTVCNKRYQSNRGIYNHVESNHIDKILKLRNETISASIRCGNKGGKYG